MLKMPKKSLVAFMINDYVTNVLASRKGVVCFKNLFSWFLYVNDSLS